MRISIQPIMKDTKTIYSYLNFMFILMKNIKSLEWFDYIKVLINLSSHIYVNQSKDGWINDFCSKIDDKLHYIGIHFGVRIFNNMPR